MKRADQHEVAGQSVSQDTYHVPATQPDEAGIDTPCEKETPLPEQTQSPSMGALPVDTPGGAKNKNQKDVDQETEIIATGSGPDPEHHEDE